MILLQYKINRKAALEMTYNEFINNILETRGRFACGEEYHERHHIVPKCMGGTNEEENLIDLFAREHFEAHRMLALENPDVHGLVYAWWCMCHGVKRKCQDRYEVSAEEYEEARINISNNIKGKNNPMYGVRGELHPSYGIKRYKDKNPFYGKHHSEETKEKLREIANNRSEETKKKISESRKGTPAHNKGVPMSDEQKRKLKDSRKNKKTILCIETNILYKSIGDAAKQTGINRKCISNCLNGRSKTAGRYHWQFI